RGGRVTNPPQAISLKEAISLPHKDAYEGTAGFRTRRGARRDSAVWLILLQLHPGADYGAVSGPGVGCGEMGPASLQSILLQLPGAGGRAGFSLLGDARGGAQSR